MTFVLPPYDKHFGGYAESGGYQLTTYQRALAATKGRKLAIDVGAHVGFWSCHMAKDFERVIAFEPEPENFRCLRQNTTDKNVTCLQIALWSHKDRGSMMCPEAGYNNSGSWQVWGNNSEGTVDIEPLDNFNFTPDLIKIDVESSELAVLYGAKETLLRARPTVCVETRHNYQHDPKPGEFLRSLGFILVEAYRKDEIWKWP